MKIEDLTENDVIHIRNKKEAKGIAKMLTEAGYIGNCGSDIESFVSVAYKQHEKELCVNAKKSGVLHASKRWYKEQGRTIIPASKFLKPSLKKRVKDLEKWRASFEQPKAATSIEVHFDEVEKLPEQYPIGKWVKEPDIERGKALYFIVSIDADKDINPVNSYGINRNGDWRAIDGRSLSLTNWPIATDEEVKTALIAEAERRGFKEGVIVRNHQGGNKLFDFDVRLDTDPEVGGIYVQNSNHTGVWLMMNGIWSEIMSEPEIDFSKAGQLVWFDNNPNHVCVTTGWANDRYFSATNLRTGDHSDMFIIENFKLFQGELTLSN